MERNEWEKHAKTAAEGIQALNWLVVKPAPRDFIDSYIGGSDYWANNIRKEFRNINADQIAFCDTFKGILTGMMAYVKEFHTTGVAWNPKGIDTKDYEKGASPAPAAAKPPAPPAEAAKVDAPAATGAKPAVNLLAALQEKGNVTAGLKAVSKEQQTWRAEYKGDKSEPAKPKAPVAKRPVEQVKGTPKIEFVGPQNKWYVQYQSGPEEVVVTIKDKKESVYILGCLNASIRVVGKCNGIIVDSCKKCNVVFDTTMASFELVNCQRMHATCMEKVSSFAIDKTDGCIVTLPKSSLDSEIFASKSSEMNVQWYDENDDLVEKPIPEQYVHRIVDGVITANVSDLYS